MIVFLVLAMSYAATKGAWFLFGLLGNARYLLWDPVLLGT